MTKLTPGQQEISNIVAEMSPRHHGTWKDDNSHFYTEFADKIRSNKIISEDSITGKPLSNFNYSKSYVRWVINSCRKIEIRKEFPRISLDHFDYYRAGRYSDPAYMGGVKYNTTYSCLFSLYKNIPLCPHGWDLAFIENEGYSTIIGGGNHRSLAMMLLGKTNINPECLFIYKDTPKQNRLLNDSFLKIEKLLNGRNFQTETDGSEQDIDDILYFHTSIKAHEEILIMKYLDKFHSRYNFHQKILNIEKLTSILNEIRGVYSYYENKKKSFITRLKSKFTKKSYREESIEKFIVEVESAS